MAIRFDGNALVVVYGYFPGASFILEENMNIKIPVLVIACLMLSSGTAATARASESGQAMQHSAQSAAHGAVSTAQVASGAVAVPMAVSGAAGQSSGATANVLMDAAASDAGQPLPVTDEPITAGPPPDQALGADNGNKPAKQ